MLFESRIAPAISGPVVLDGAQSNGYVKRGRKPGRPPVPTGLSKHPLRRPYRKSGAPFADVDLRLTESDKNPIADVVTMLSDPAAAGPGQRS